jgi:hypothetical protein
MRVEVNWGGELVAVIRGVWGGSEEEARVVGFAMRDDDWEVTRLASLQPIRAEQISC